MQYASFPKAWMLGDAFLNSDSNLHSGSHFTFSSEHLTFHLHFQEAWPKSTHWETNNQPANSGARAALQSREI